MLRKTNNVQKVAVYLGMVIFLEFMLIMLPMKIDGIVYMFVPFASVILTMLLTGEAFSKQGWGQLGFHRFSMKYVIIGFLVPALPIIIGFSIVWLTGLGKLGLPSEYEGQVPLLIIGFFITLIMNALTFTLGEEIGWRGYLEAKLRSLGHIPSIWINGLIWSLFHLPIMIFTDAYHDGVNLFIYIPMFIVTVTFAGAFMTHLKYVTGSIWPAIAAHTVHNLVWNYGDLLTLNAKPIVTYLTGDAGIVLIVFYLIVFAMISKKTNGMKHHDSKVTGTNSMEQQY